MINNKKRNKWRWNGLKKKKFFVPFIQSLKIYLLTALLRVENKLRYAYMNNHDSFTEEYFTLKAFK